MERSRESRIGFPLLLVILAAAGWAVGCGSSSSGDDVATDDGSGEGADVPDTDDGSEAGDDGGETDVPPACGNGDVDTGEDCDDGNTVAGDGCENDCTFTCDTADDTCPVEQHCDDATHMCVAGCRADEGCSDPTPFCDVPNNTCVVCLINDNCPAGEVCVDLDCVPGCDATHPCGGSDTCCGGGCIETDTSLEHCGGCDVPCAVTDGTPACVGGVCTVESCDAGYADCNTTVTDGCEIVTDTDLLNCGGCGVACPAAANATTTCVDGTCGFECTGTYDDCDGLADTGCESDLQNDAGNCGVCGTACVVTHGTPGCVAGACTVGTCETGYGDCDGDATNGCETPTSDDLSNCGGCGVVCATPAHGGAACSAGVCGISSCDTGWADCDGVLDNGCEADTLTGTSNCGVCGNVCAVTHATAGCAAGSCTIATCDAGWSDCNVSVTDGCETGTTADVTNCGGCGVTCATPANGVAGCTSSACGIASCATGWGNCNSVVADGCEVDTTTATANCGTCGVVCPTPSHAAAACTAGTCGLGACTSGWGDCDSDASTGCETGLATIINCGACGFACNYTNGTASCPTGTCQIACNANFGNCNASAADGCEVDFRTDNLHCGNCTTACAGGRVCVASTCQLLPPANDTRAGAITIPTTTAQTTLSADTTSANNNTSGTCACTSGRDVYYTFTLTQQELIYADTIGTAWDTSLFLQDSAGVNLSASGLTAGAVCSDNGGGGCTSGSQSMVLALLNAGTYYLVLSGCSQGTATIHFQHLPTGNGTLTQITTLTGTQTFTGTTSGTGRVTSACNGGGPENTYWFITCPTFASIAFAATTIGGAAWDTVLDQRSASRTPTAVCNDDTCTVQSRVVSTLPAGAGIHSLYADGFGTSAGAYTMGVVFGGCPTGQSLCGASTCRALQTDANNCGCCGTVCAAPAHATPGCAAGTCGIGACTPGWGNCDANTSNGCETDVTSNSSHCGACGNVCGAGTTCVASACRPSNDRCAAATPVNLTLGARITLTGTTTNAYHDLTVGCATTTAAPDVYYSFTLTQRELVYVDTFGSAYDTVLSFASGCATPITVSTTPGDRVCDNDRGGLCTTGGTASQIVARLNPGTYYLLVSGNGTASGAFTLRFEHLAIGGGDLVQLAAGLNNYAGTTTGGANAYLPSCLGAYGTGPEDGFWWRTCPESAGGSFIASTCGGATWDTVLALNNGSGVGNACVDDDPTCSSGTLRARVSSTIGAGSGLHVLILDGYWGANGAYSMSVVRP